MKIIISIFILLVTMVSCEKTIKNLDIDRPDSKMVVNGILTNDTSGFLHISQSRYPYGSDTSNHFPEAYANLFFENQLIGTFIYDQLGYYSIDEKQLSPGNYRLEVNSPNLPSTEIEIQLGKEPTMALVDTFTSITYHEDCIGCPAMRNTSITISFQDDPNTKDYYHLTCQFSEKVYEYSLEEFYDDTYDYYYYEHVLVDSGIVLSKMDMMTEENIIDLIKGYGYYQIVTQDEDPYGNEFFFHDGMFNGQSYEFTFSVAQLLQRLNPENPQIHIQLSKIDKSYYEYGRSMAQFDLTYDNPLAEKVTIYSNVTNGLGLFTSKSTTEFVLDFSYLYEYKKPDQQN